MTSLRPLTFIFLIVFFSRKKSSVGKKKPKRTYVTKAVLNNHRKKEHALGLLYQHPPQTLIASLPKGC